MEQPLIQFTKTNPDAVTPAQNNSALDAGDSGFDLYSIESITIPGRGSRVVNVGLTLAYITPGYWFRIEPRSGLGFKHSIQPHLGIIDNQYRGDLGVKLYNFSDEDYTVNLHDRIAQFVVYKLIQPKVEIVDTVTKTNRGDSGFGSSGR